MIISHKHRFVFIQVPRTASSFLGAYFFDHYSGEIVADKHSTYRQFLKNASEEEKTYKVIIGKRHPLDKTVTLYARIRPNQHKSGVALEEIQKDFENWLLKQSLKRKSVRSVQHLKDSYPYADHVISQENLKEDLTLALNSMGLELADDLIWKHRTNSKQFHYTQYYSEHTRPIVLRTFRKEMEQLDYAPPPGWEKYLIS